MPCECCDTPPALAPWVESAAVSTAGSRKLPRCYFTDPEDGKPYRTKTVVKSGEDSWDSAWTVGPGVPNEDGELWDDCTSVGSKSYESTETTTLSDPDDPDDPCITTRTSTGSSASSHSFRDKTYSPDGTFNTGYGYDQECTSTMSNDIWTGTSYEAMLNYDDTIASEETTPRTDPCEAPSNFALDITTTYSDPVEGETDAEMIARILEDLPEYGDEYGSGPPHSMKDFESESHYGIKRSKWRLAHHPTGTCYLKVWLQRRYTPSEGDEVITPLSPYTWEGSGNPCFAEPDKSAYDEENIIHGSPAEESEPEENGTTTIEIFKWSCLPDYTPPDDGSANGFPVE